MAIRRRRLWLFLSTRGPASDRLLTTSWRTSTTAQHSGRDFFFAFSLRLPFVKNILLAHRQHKKFPKYYFNLFLSKLYIWTLILTIKQWISLKHNFYGSQSDLFEILIWQKNKDINCIKRVFFLYSPLDFKKSNTLPRLKKFCFELQTKMCTWF